MGKKVLVVGGGGREHAICWSIMQDKAKHRIYCAPGNAGIAQVAHCVAIEPTDIEGLLNFAKENEIDLTIVGGEVPLSLGIVDEFERNNLKIIGPSLSASRLESSKAFAKEFMTRHKIPTAPFIVADSPEDAVYILESGRFGGENEPVVVKADGLASGKGVVMAANRSAAISAINQLTNNTDIDKKATKNIVLERMLQGIEVSLLLFSDGKNFALMPPSRDYKRIGNNNTGANTGGMGSICDDNLLTNSQIHESITAIIKPTLEGASKEGFEFRGILFLGLILTDSGVKLIEYNVRFGDPETQSILLRLQTNLTDICDSIINQQLDKAQIKFDNQKSCCIILAAKNYPAKPTLGDHILGLETVNENIVIFHSGTIKTLTNKLLTNGGRVLGIAAKANNLKASLDIAYNSVQNITWKGMQYRKDIGS